MAAPRGSSGASRGGDRRGGASSRGGKGRPGAKRTSSKPGAAKPGVTRGAGKPGGPKRGAAKRTSSSRGQASKRSGPPRGAKRASERREDQATAGWGGVARKGAGRLKPIDADARGGSSRRGGGGKSPKGRVGEGGAGGASEAWRAASGHEAAEAARARPPRDLEEWVLVEEIRDEAEHAVERASAAPTKRERAERERKQAAAQSTLRKQLDNAVGSSRTDKVEKQVRDAAKDFEAERFAEAARRLRPLSERAPSVAAVRELYGLTLYRQGKWKLAVEQLEAFRTLSDSTDQHPVLADCYRALRQWARVEELWDELRQQSPSGELVTEGRIVMAGALADRGDVNGAVRLLEQGWKFPKRARVHHLRRAYVLADLYERAGEVARARELFERIRAVDPDFADVRARLRTLG